MRQFQRLDCHDLKTALISLAGAIGVTVDGLAQALRDHTDSGIARPREDPWWRMSREVLERFGTSVDDMRFEGAYYFHGTRVIDPERFRSRGILPLDQMVEEMWPMLYDLVRSERTKEQWAEFRALVEGGDCGPYGRTCEHFSYLYRLKTGDRLHFGPFGYVVRETAFDPHAALSHDYLRVPEIVQDIATCYREVYGVDLERRFRDASKACIVKFRSAQLLSGAIVAALWYVRLKLRDEELADASNWSFDGEGVPVPPDAIANVEVVAARR